MDKGMGCTSERKPLLRAVGYNLLFRFDHSTFYKNRARAQQARLMRSEHFSVDGTLIRVVHPVAFPEFYGDTWGFDEAVAEPSPYLDSIEVVECGVTLWPKKWTKLGTRRQCESVNRLLGSVARLSRSRSRRSRRLPCTRSTSSRAARV